VSKPIQSRSFAIAALALVPFLGAGGCAEPQPVGNTRIIGTMFFAGKLRPGESASEFRHTPTRSYLESKGRGRGLQFEAHAGAGPVWAVVHVVARPQSPSDRGEALLSLGPTNTRMNALDAGMALHSRNMRRPAVDWMAAGTTPMIGANPKGHLSDDDLAALAQPDSLLRAVEVFRYPMETDDDGDAQFLLTLDQHRNLRPLFVEVTLGQGPLPRELQAFIRDANGPWYVRYRNEAGGLAAILLLGAFVLWRLRAG
jgi:hypothetical protein